MNSLKNRFVGHKITDVSYMSSKEVENHMWYNKALIITLDNGTFLYPSRDDEGNDAGALFTGNDKNDVLPVLPVNINDDLMVHWENIAKSQLIGATITSIRYMDEGECDSLGWYNSSIIFFLDNNNYFFPSQDDEGNDAGAIFTSDNGFPVIPVQR